MREADRVMGVTFIKLRAGFDRRVAAPRTARASPRLALIA
jgi:hypothetical protein